MPKDQSLGLTGSQVQTFIDNGYVKLDHAFGRDLVNRP